MVTRACATCDKAFEVPLFRVNEGGGKYCSRRCRNLGQKALRDSAARRQDMREEFRGEGRARGDKPRW